jgi:hypothetical protein
MKESSNARDEWQTEWSKDTEEKDAVTKPQSDEQTVCGSSGEAAVLYLYLLRGCRGCCRGCRGCCRLFQFQFECALLRLVLEFPLLAVTVTVLALLHQLRFQLTDDRLLLPVEPCTPAWQCGIETWKRIRTHNRYDTKVCRISLAHMPHLTRSHAASHSLTCRISLNHMPHLTHSLT